MDDFIVVSDFRANSPNRGLLFAEPEIRRPPPRLKTGGRPPSGSRAAQKPLYDRRREEGRCVSCGKEAYQGMSRCIHCMAKVERNRTELRAERRRLGRCVDCGRESGRFHTCSDCREKRSEAKRDMRARNGAKGLCTRCDRPAALGRRLCSRHLEMDRKRKR